MYTAYMAKVSFPGVASVRADLKSALDAAAIGTPVAFERDRKTFAVVDADRLRRTLSILAARPEVAHAGDRWELFFIGIPVDAEGGSLDELYADAVVSLREYADDWTERLYMAPNHADNWGLVQLVALSTDEQLRDWIGG